MKKPVITIDGPSGAGKSTVSRALADRLGYSYLNTGVMYRAVALKILRSDVDPEDEYELKILLSRLNLSFEEDGSKSRIFLNGEDVSRDIKTPEISMLASYISLKPCVREILFHIQRRIGEKGNIVLEGRDMGTVVFPDADIKFYLDASPEIRTSRRHREIVQMGKHIDWQEVFEDLERRDASDMKRDISPLEPAEDAIIIESSHMTIEEVVDSMLNVINKHISH